MIALKKDENLLNKSLLALFFSGVFVSADGNCIINFSGFRLMTDAWNILGLAESAGDVSGAAFLIGIFFMQHATRNKEHRS